MEGQILAVYGKDKVIRLAEIKGEGVKNAHKEKKEIEMDKTLRQDLRNFGHPLFEKQGDREMNENREIFGDSTPKVEPREPINWERVKENFNWTQYGFCPECGNNDGILFLTYCNVSHCQKCKILWLNVYTRHPEKYEGEFEENAKFLEDYREATEEEEARAHTLVYGFLDWLRTRQGSG